MNYKTIKSTFHNELGRILMLNKKRGIEDHDVMKVLLKYHLNKYGLSLELPYNDFSDVISIDYDKSYYNIIEKIKLNVCTTNIIELLVSELQKMDVSGTLKFSNILPRIIIKNGTKYIQFKFYVSIDSVKIIHDKNISYILQNKRNNSYYLKSCENSLWVGVSSKTECKIFNDIDKLAETIIANDFKDIKLIKQEKIKMQAKNYRRKYQLVEYRQARLKN